MTLSVHATGKVTITVPRFVSKREAHAFYEERSQWVEAALRRLGVSSGTHTQQHARLREVYLARKDEARALVLQRLADINRYYGYEFKRVRICVTTSRWGSASATGTLSFDFRILYLPRTLQDYLLTHELCHLKEMNHSARFWNLVAQTIPDHVERRRALHRLERTKLG